MFETILKKNLVFLSIYLYIYENLKFHILKILLHPSTLNPKSRLVNSKGISVFYPSLKMMVKMVSVNMKSGTINVIFVAISLKYLHVHFLQILILMLNIKYLEYN